MSTDALELALALHQAPIQRFTVRDRPLPKNIGEALQLASQMQPQLKMAAARFSEPEETIVEAVRFYLLQVLFEPGTDAYRVLGLTPNAEFSVIRQHHIWLQRWLHPDRRGEEWEALLATKINWAWQQLRNESSRKQYDEEHRQGKPAQAGDIAASAVVPPHAWNVEPIETAGTHWLRRGVIGSLIIVCSGLFYLALNRQDRVDPDALVSQAMNSSPATDPRVPVDAGSDQRKPPVKSDSESTRAEDVANADAAGPIEIALTRQDSIADALAKPRVSDHRAELSTEVIEESGLVRDHLSAEVPAVSRPTPSNLVVNDTALRNGPASRNVDAAPIGMPPRNTADAKKPVAPRLGENEPIRQVEPMGSGAIASGVGDRATEVSEPNNERGSVVVSAQPATDPASVAVGNVPVATTSRNIAPNAAVVRAGLPKAQPSGGDGLANESIDTSADTAPSSTNAGSSQAPESVSREALARFELARDRVRSMVRYFRSQDVRLPQWDDDHGQRTAEHERDALHARSGRSQIERFALDPPSWRITSSAVELEAVYHVDTNRAASESGQFNLDMAWRDGNWKITRIKVTPGR